MMQKVARKITGPKVLVMGQCKPLESSGCSMAPSSTMSSHYTINIGEHDCESRCGFLDIVVAGMVRWIGACGG
jgi:hypothetical protein